MSHDVKMLVLGSLLGKLSIRKNNCRCRTRMLIVLKPCPSDVSLYYATIQETRKHHGATRLQPSGRLVTEGRLGRPAHWMVIW